ncbi:hypothetical protein Rhopal_001970-T1 [Rhodotorula paludigena]|uniref:DNA repair protein REV1 n=1 Tax=Rhodotorula paludigena TaxID=86838 RepID=A0AAV5GII5_9BASI|nr:hypothetical protein Rhopal_001970-T1 [Rhodotorula paludigena]
MAPPDSIEALDPDFERSLAEFDVDASLNPRVVTLAKRTNDGTEGVHAGPSTEKDTLEDGPDYRDSAFYDAVHFGEFGRYMRNKRAKLQVQNKALLEDGKERPQIFKGLRVYINGYTESITLPELQNLLILHGGVYVPYLDQKALVTHIVATNLTPSKRKEFASYKVATPDWLVDSASEGKLLDWRDYSLLAPPKSAMPASPTKAAGRGGFDEEAAARLGTQTGQRSLFSMGVGKGKAKEEPSKSSRRRQRGADDEADASQHDLSAVEGLVPSTSRVDGPSSAGETDYRDSTAYEASEFGGIGQFMRNKRVKLQVQHNADVAEAKDCPQIFKGLRIYINGHTGSITLPEMQRLLILHGGVYVPYLDQKALVTHILASNLTPSKRQEFAAYKVATPDWLIDSAREGKLLDWRKYSLLAPSASTATSAPTPAGRGGFDEEAVARLGTSSAQRSLFAMGVGQDKDKQHADSPLAAQKAASGATSSTSAAVNPFFRPRSAVSTSSTTSAPSRPTTPTKEKLVSSEAPDRYPPPVGVAAKLPATTDSPDKPNAVTHSWLPQAQRTDRQNALLGDSDWLMKHTSASPDFLQGYFAQSRLHWISTFKEELKLRAAAEQTANTPQRRKKLTGRASDGRTIFHVDFDCFFVSAGLTTRPELRGKPVAVCHARGNADSASSTSEIASCSYEARASGVRNGMSLGRARELCAEIQTMPFEFELYKSISTKFYGILLSHASFLQAVSIDEVLMEVKVPPTILRDQDPALELAERIRAEILAATGCQASIGISHNILLARLATRKAKPAGAYHLLVDEVDEYLAPLGVDELHGIGWNLREKLKSALQVETIGDLRKIPPYKLASVLGPENGKKFAAFAQGVDDRELETGKARQSVSTEVNYGIRFPEDRDDLVERFVRELGAETAKRLRDQGLQARQLTLKVMQRHPEAPIETPKFLGHGWAVTENKVSSLAGRQGGATDDDDVVGETAWKLMRSMRAPTHELRGIGIQLSKLEKNGVPVDQVLEKGQSKLSFKPVDRPRPPEPAPLARPASPPTSSTAAPSEQHRASSIETVTISSSPLAEASAAPASRLRASPPPAALLRKEPSAIILDSDSSPEPPAPVVAALPALRPRKKRTPEPYIPSMFRATKKTAAPPPPTAGSVTDAELVYYGLDPDIYHSLDGQLRMEVLADARRSKPRPLPSKLRGGKQTTPTTFDVPDQPKAAPKPAPEVVVLPPSPSELTDTQIAAMQYDPGMFRELGKSTQLEQIELHQQRQARLVVGNRPKRAAAGGGAAAGAAGSGAAGPSARLRAPVKDVSVRQPPRFQGKVDLSEIQDRLEKWVRVARDVGPDNDDLDTLGAFVEKCASRERGHNLKKAVDVLQWWRCVLEAECGTQAKAQGVAAVWWDGYERVRERLEWLVLKETGCRLHL